MSGRTGYTVVSGDRKLPVAEVLNTRRLQRPKNRVSSGLEPEVVKRFWGWTSSHAHERAVRWLRKTGRWPTPDVLDSEGKPTWYDW